MEMEHRKVTEEWLYNYMPIVDEAIIRELEETTNDQYQFSDKFERKMKKLIWREAHPRMSIFYRQFKRVAVFLFCIMSSIFLLSMSVPASRIKFFETVKTMFEDSVLYSYFVNEKQESFVCNEPAYIPAGYQEIDRIITEHWFNITYKNEYGEMIIWDQMLIQDGGSLVMDLEYDQQILKEINGDNVIINVYSDGYINAYYEHGQYVYLLVANHISIEDVSFIFQSIVNYK